MSFKYRLAPPKPSAMLEALRGLGYSTAAAIADLLDNSVSAGAKEIQVLFEWDGERSRIAIVDDGRGMSEDELDRAMRLGARSPLDERSSDDLGRFGLGLKTASFSQCRRLTVLSRKDGEESTLRWDLDVLEKAADDAWMLLDGPAPGSEKHLQRLGDLQCGTVVLWEVLDRIVTPGFGEQDYLDVIDRVQQHLAMVFHRFIGGVDPRLRLRINGMDVLPWDPYLAFHAATWSSPIDRMVVSGGVVEVQGFVLPHKDRLDARTFEAAAGPDGWTAQQGFYVYRNERMLMAGSWLGLGQGRFWTKEEAHRLARIRLDIPNSTDSDWKIDIRKSVARPPVAVRDRLTRLAEDVRARARRVFAHRGEHGGGVGGEVTTAWVAARNSGGIRYRIDTDHPGIRAVVDEAGGLLPAIKAMLRIIEETVPVQRIWLDTAESRETPRTGFSGAPPEEAASVLRVLYRNLVVRKGLSPERAKEKLSHSEPFNRYPDLVQALPDDLSSMGDDS